MEGGITPSQCRTARAIVGWSQDALAERAGISRATLVEFEKGARAMHGNNLAAIRLAFEAEHVEFDMEEGGRIGLTFPDSEG